MGAKQMSLSTDNIGELRDSVVKQIIVEIMDAHTQQISEKSSDGILNMLADIADKIAHYYTRYPQTHIFLILLQVWHTGDSNSFEERFVNIFDQNGRIIANSNDNQLNELYNMPGFLPLP